ncbi:integrase core domain-containing protein [Rugamonas apoptosis]|uniref:Transposase family protein n=1 Tax=Rugamonas apoptosis TaxID=2758570 RepID=A0A7W2FE03_9BURK|nr:integrase core domain-containing protein [Rugamonas apoptosis]MBA5689968.1 transposase family protein [Rugamonas apoptosis]
MRHRQAPARLAGSGCPHSLYCAALHTTPIVTICLILLLLALRTLLLPRPRRRAGRRIIARPVAGRSRRKPAWVRREIIRLKALTGFSCHKLAHTFNRMYAVEREVTVGKTWVAQVVCAHRYEIADLRRRYKRRVPPPVRSNATWGLDYTGKTDTTNTVYPVIGIIDHGSRLALALRPLRQRTAVATLKALLLTVETFGTPGTIRTDNDAVFTSRLFRFGLRWLGIRHQPSQPGCPWQNGRVERLFGTLKEKLDQFAVPDFHALERALAEFRFWYNAVRPHQHLNGWTPKEAWHGRDPYVRAPKSVRRFHAWDGLLEGVHLRW